MSRRDPGRNSGVPGAGVFLPPLLSPAVAVHGSRWVQTRGLPYGRQECRPSRGDRKVPPPGTRSCFSEERRDLRPERKLTRSVTVAPETVQPSHESQLEPQIPRGLSFQESSPLFQRQIDNSFQVHLDAPVKRLLHFIGRSAEDGDVKVNADRFPILAVAVCVASKIQLHIFTNVAFAKHAMIVASPCTKAWIAMSWQHFNPSSATTPRVGKQPRPP